MPGPHVLCSTTGIFPIMHVVAIRRSLYEKHPWIAMSLYKAFVRSQRETYDDLYVTAALKTMLPWLTRHVEDARIGAGLEHVVRAERCDLIVADVRHGAEATRDCLNLVRIDVQPDTHEACPRELDGHRQAGVTESNHGDAC